MTPEALAALRHLLRQHEGVRPTFYLDTRGIPTIGVGRNLRDKGLSSAEVDYLLDNDIFEAQAALNGMFDWFVTLDTPRQLALIDLAFMGPAKLRGFPKMIAALATRDYATAASELLDSAYAREVGQRAKDLAAILRTGALA